MRTGCRELATFVRRTGSFHPIRLYSLLYRQRRIDGRPRSPWIGRRNIIHRRRARSVHSSSWTARARGRSSAARSASTHARSPEDMRSRRGTARPTEADEARTNARVGRGRRAVFYGLHPAEEDAGASAGTAGHDRAGGRERDCGHSQKVRFDHACSRMRGPVATPRAAADTRRMCSSVGSGANAWTVPSRRDVAAVPVIVRGSPRPQIRGSIGRPARCGRCGAARSSSRTAGLGARASMDGGSVGGEEQREVPRFAAVPAKCSGRDGGPAARSARTVAVRLRSPAGEECGAKRFRA